MNKKRFSFKVFFVSLLVIYISVIVSNVLVLQEIESGWYKSVRPDITPPDYVFQIVWTILYFLIAASFTLFYVNSERKTRGNIAQVYLANLVFNMIWTIVFFGHKLISIALFDLLLVWLSILYLIIHLWKKHKIAAVLLIPYLIWISFALLINYLCLGKV